MYLIYKVIDSKKIYLHQNGQGGFEWVEFNHAGYFSKEFVDYFKSSNLNSELFSLNIDISGMIGRVNKPNNIYGVLGNPVFLRAEYVYYIEVIAIEQIEKILKWNYHKILVFPFDVYLFNGVQRIKLERVYFADFTRWYSDVIINPDGELRLETRN